MSSATLEDSGRGFFLWILRNFNNTFFIEHLFYRTLLVATSVQTMKFWNFTYICKRLLHKRVSTIFLTMSYSFFIVIYKWVYKWHLFCTKTRGKRLFKNTWKEDTRKHSFVCVLTGWLATFHQGKKPMK